MYDDLFPYFLCVIILASAGLWFITSRRKERYRRHVLHCGDESARCEPGAVIAGDSYQLPTRILGPVDVCIRDIELFRSSIQQANSSVAGLDFLRHFRTVDFGDVVVCPYPDNFVDFIVANPELYPEEWKYRNVWFFGRVYWNKGAFVRGIRWDSNENRPAAMSLQLTSSLGGNDYIAVVRMKKAEPHRELAHA